MDALDCILGRRSIRDFEGRAVEREKLEILLEAARAAPSAKNGQARQFVVIDDKKLLEKVPKFSPYAKMAASAPLGILVCGDKKREVLDGFWLQDASLSGENILLAAHAQGLGAVWTAAYPLQDRVEGFRDLLDLPENIIPLCLILIGYPAGEPRDKETVGNEVVHKNGWKE